MKVKHVELSYTKNLGNYESVKAGISLEPEGDETYEELFEKARQIVASEAEIEAEWLRGQDKASAKQAAIKRNLEAKGKI